MFDISSKHYAHLTVTYYKNGTLLVQGRITSLMADFISITAELLFQKQEDKYVILETCSIFSEQESQPFCNLFTFFKKYRDKLSHADNVVETTTIIEDRGICFDIITDGFRFINDYCKHWN